MNIEKKVKSNIAFLLDIKEKEISLSSKLEDLGFDSIDLVEFAYRLGDDFEIEIYDENLEHLITVEDAIKYVEKNI